jgi:ankyrin repeat protein
MWYALLCLHLQPYYSVRFIVLQFGSTPILHAARHGNVDIVKVLVEEYGADPTHRNAVSVACSLLFMWQVDEWRIRQLLLLVLLYSVTV